MSTSTEQLMKGVHATSRWFLEIAMPWIEVAVRYKSKPTPLHPEFSSGVNPATRPTGQENMPIFRPADTWVSLAMFSIDSRSGQRRTDTLLALGLSLIAPMYALFEHCRLKSRPESAR